MSIVFPDVVAVTVAHVRTFLEARTESFTDDVWVANGTDKDPDGSGRRDPRMVIIRGDGGNRLSDVRGLARLGVNIWHETDEGVTDLANLVSAVIAGMANVGPVRRATASLPADVTDDAPRRYVTAEVLVRGVSL